jgi:hypothetical protein
MSAGAVLPGAAGAQEPRASKDDPSPRVCKNIVKAGSRLSTRICRTQQQWGDAMDKTQDGVLQHQMGPGTDFQPRSKQIG